jgi:ribulose 1,5-bisphosphate synthetase/thiazole synthase
MGFDHIIIGSGINGLVAASMLALKGDRVLVLEREARLGGCLMTDEITVPATRMWLKIRLNVGLSSATVQSEYNSSTDNARGALRKAAMASASTAARIGVFTGTGMAWSRWR